MAEFRLKPVAVVDRMLPVIDLPDARPFLVGNGPHDYLCSSCDNGLLLKIDITLPQNVIIICGKCRSAMVLDTLSP
jgi:hypothetical protein